MDPYDFDPYDQDGRRKKAPSSRSTTKIPSSSVSIPSPSLRSSGSKSSLGSRTIRSPQSFLREKRLHDAAAKLTFQNTLQHEINTRTYQLRQTLAEINILCIQLGINESYNVDEVVFEHRSLSLGSPVECTTSWEGNKGGRK